MEKRKSNASELLRKIEIKIQNSNRLKITRKINNSIIIESNKKELFLTPAMYKFKIKLDIIENEYGDSKTSVKVKGNPIINLFKYLFTFMIIVLFPLIYYLEIYKELPGIQIGMIGPIILLIVFTVRNNKNIKEGKIEIDNILKTQN